MMNPRISQIRRAVMNLALPVTVSSLLQRTEGILDIFLVGGLGPASIAAVGLGQLLVFVAMTLIAGLSVSATVVIAQLWGARRHRDAGEAAAYALGLAVVASLVLMGIGLVASRPAMTLLGAGPDVMRLAGPYVDLIFLIIPFTVLLQVVAATLHGTGDTRTPMYAMIGVNVLHVCVAYPMIYGRWGFPDLGVNGAAIAVGVAEGSGLLFLLVRCQTLLVRPKALRSRVLLTFWEVGAPVSGERMIQQAGILVYTKVVLLYGTVVYAAHQVGLSIESFSFMPGHGFAVAAATMVGQSIGASKYARAKLENWEANRLAAFVMAAMGFIFFFFPYALLEAFTADQEVIELGSLFLKIVAVVQIPLAITMVLAGSLRGAGDTGYIMGATIAGMWGVRVPVAVIGALWFHLSIGYIWCAMVGDWVLRMGLLVLRYRSERWREIKMIR
jgi:putative MATE family efflux protein